jgi:hypothetical protein
MQYSPKLKKAMEEIKKILSDNDIAAFVVLHTPGFSEYLNNIETSYSCAKLNSDGITFRLKQAEVGKEKAQQIAEGTFNMITHFADTIAMNVMVYMEAQKFLKEKWQGQEFRGGHSSHNSQNN